MDAAGVLEKKPGGITYESWEKKNYLIKHIFALYGFPLIRS